VLSAALHVKGVVSELHSKAGLEYGRRLQQALVNGAQKSQDEFQEVSIPIYGVDRRT
jgi:hypothetical protein